MKTINVDSRLYGYYPLWTREDQDNVVLGNALCGVRGAFNDRSHVFGNLELLPAYVNFMTSDSYYILDRAVKL